MNLFLLTRIFSATLSLLILIAEMPSPNKLDGSVKKSNKLSKEFIFLHSIKLLSCCCVIFYYCRFWLVHLNGSNENVLNSSSAVALSGLAICLLGKYFRIRAKQDLGRFFTYEVGVSEEQKLIKTGLYSHLMHPSYLGAILMYFGTCIMYTSILLYFFLIVKLFGLINRMVVEEKELLSSFGKDFQEYRSQRWRMIPYIY